MSLAQRRGMVDREHLSLSTVRQGALLGVARSSLYCRPRKPPREPGLDASHGPAVPGYTLLRVEAHEGLAGPGGQVREPEAGAAADAHHGAKGHLQASPHQPKVAAASGLSMPVEKFQDHPAQPGLGLRHHLPVHGPKIPLPGGSHGLAQPLLGNLAAVQHLGSRLCAEGPEVFNANQGSQFSSLEFTQVLQDRGVKISMDGRGGIPTTSSSSGCGGR